MSTDVTYPALPYLPQSVRLSKVEADYVVVDTDGLVIYKGTSYERATRFYNVRRSVVKAAITRRLNKAVAFRNERRESKCEANNVTWEWLRIDLSEAEADAWLGLDC